jgi:hypothetical protein
MYIWHPDVDRHRPARPAGIQHPSNSPAAGPGRNTCFCNSASGDRPAIVHEPPRPRDRACPRGCYGGVWQNLGLVRASDPNPEEARAPFPALADDQSKLESMEQSGPELDAAGVIGDVAGYLEPRPDGRVMKSFRISSCKLCVSAWVPVLYLLPPRAAASGKASSHMGQPGVAKALCGPARTRPNQFSTASQSFATPEPQKLRNQAHAFPDLPQNSTPKNIPIPAAPVSLLPALSPATSRSRLHPRRLPLHHVELRSRR